MKSASPNEAWLRHTERLVRALLHASEHCKAMREHFIVAEQLLNIDEVNASLFNTSVFDFLFLNEARLRRMKNEVGFA
jgi:hypothetical protein